MSRYWQYLLGKAESVYGLSRLSGVTISYDSALPASEVRRIVGRSKKISPLQSSSLVSVALFDDWVVKSDARPIKRRLRSSSMSLDSIKGVSGPLAEAVNTLWAESSLVPGHRLLGLHYNRLKRRSFLVLERLHLLSASELLASHDAVSILNSVVPLFKEALEKKLFHCDSNLSNIMLNDALGDAHYIDYRFAIRRNCPMGHAMALQLATLRDWRLQPFISEDEFFDWVKQYLDSNFEDAGASYELFLEFAKNPLNGKARRERLRLVGCNNPDFLS